MDNKRRGSTGSAAVSPSSSSSSSSSSASSSQSGSARSDAADADHSDSSSSSVLPGTRAASSAPLSVPSGYEPKGSLRPPSFSGRTEDFQGWRFKFLTYLRACGLNPYWRRVAHMTL
jgi:hypothetical protein